MSITRDLARAVIASRPADLPREVRHEAVRALVNWIGLPVWGSRDEMVEKTLAALDPFSGPRQDRCSAGRKSSIRSRRRC